MHATTPEAAADQAAVLKAALQEATDAIDKYTKISVQNAGKTGLDHLGEVSQCQINMQASVRKLDLAVRGPVTMIFSHFENATFAGSVRTCVDLGVFEALPMDGTPMSSKDLAEKVKCEEDLLLRLIRCSIPDLFAEPKPNEFAHTPFSMVYLAPPLRAAFEFLNDEYFPVCHLMHEWFRKEGYKTPIDETNNPYTLINRTGGLTMWEWIAKDPYMRSRFNAAMQAQSQGSGWAIPIYPFEAELSKLETTDETVLVVDVGGGRGQATRQIKELCPNIKGRMILEDLPEVINDITEPLPEGIEKLPYDFFTPQPIKGAKIYYIRRCLHDWSDAKTVQILSIIAAAMDKHSRLLIAETINPPSHVDVECAWIDFVLMTFTGRQRTKEHWARVLDQAGLRPERVCGAKGTNYGVVEAFLK